MKKLIALSLCLLALLLAGVAPALAGVAAEEQPIIEGDPFDPDRHEAVMHEPGEDDDAESSVAEVLRAGYGWKGRVLRPAMVKVRG